MFVKASRSFADKENDMIVRESGDVWEVNDTRGNRLIESGFAKRIQKPKKAKAENDN